MATLNLGQVRPVSRGEWNNGTPYKAFDFVTYTDGSVYLAVKDVPAGYQPDAQPDYWVLFGAKGKDGAQGQQGIAGVNGATFTPSVDAAGVLSWSNDGGLPNPANVNLKGPKGDMPPISDSLTLQSSTTAASSAAVKKLKDAIDAVDVNTFDYTVSVSPQANAIPQANAEGKIDAGWLSENVNSGFPRGVVLPFYNVTLGGSDGRRPVFWGATEADETYILCDGGSDGSGGTVPNLTGRMIMGANATLSDAATLGGAATHTHNISGSVGSTTLSVAQMPSHTHPIFIRINDSGGRILGASHGTAGETLYTGATGGNQAHTHSLSSLATSSANCLPPFCKLAYFVKIA